MWYRQKNKKVGQMLKNDVSDKGDDKFESMCTYTKFGR
jgi:hypothetical protein